MPRAPLPLWAERYLTQPRDAVLATMRRDGGPAAVPCWYGYSEGQVFLSMGGRAKRLENIRRDPRVALSVLANDPPRHLSLTGLAIAIRADPDLEDIDVLSQHYQGCEWHERGSTEMTTVVVKVHSWIAFGFDEIADH
ncbi:pyridoxamine 5'-phosphate oxidase family protein [Aeromicrobium sp. Root344]|uniref:pyridoxamine 5'-phosphate oxidase family protein n=1 Tax=Aeromicrobium sp. Root344 TaxID=1736521 RepID=UPI0009E6EF40|nr:pyridoxamine 5'-phosphate oxidase family protein [Aeromicrobium sp. Root344]